MYKKKSYWSIYFNLLVYTHSKFAFRVHIQMRAINLDAYIHIWISMYACTVRGNRQYWFVYDEHNIYVFKCFICA